MMDGARRELYLHPDFCAVAEDGRLVEYHDGTAEHAAGAVMLGRVERLMQGLKCAFVDIGREKAGFLPLKENSASFEGAPLRSGDRVLVQIRREENGNKGAFLSRDLTLAGQRLLLMPCNRHIGVSSRVREEAEKTRLREIGTLLAEGEHGLVVRAAAAEATMDELREEQAALRAQWERIREEAAEGACPRMIDPGDDPAGMLEREYAPRGIAAIHRGEELTGDLRRQLRDASRRTLLLPHGGNIVIDRCEALTVIDVNTAANPAAHGWRETVLETNQEACREIAIQTRLRNLSGMLVIDLINMDVEEDRERTLEELRQGFTRDRIKTVIHGFTALGLVEMTRRRSGTDMYGSMRLCPHCGGNRYIPRERNADER